MGEQGAEKRSGAASGIPAELPAILTELAQATQMAHIPHRIELIRRALALVSRTQNPPLWAALQANLGNALVENPLGDRADNLERAIEAHQQALQVFTHEAMPMEWARTQMNLANAYSNRIRGERADNLERAIAAYEQALQVFTRAAMPLERATTMMNLAGAYSDRIRGERAGNLERAIAAYEQVLQVFTREAMPVDWARTQMNLASAYRERIRGERADNLERAIAACEQALQVFTRAAMPVDWAHTMNNLANAYQNRIMDERADNLERAIAAYEQALQVFTRAAMPLERATTMMNLAGAYSDRIRGERADNLERAIAAYQQALQVFTIAASPRDHQLVQRNLGYLLFKEGGWAQAHQAYAAAVEAGGALLATAYTETGRRAEVAETAQLYARDAYCLLRLQRPEEAFLRLEQGKARLLAQALAVGDADLAPLSEAQRGALLSARRALREFEGELRQAQAATESSDVGESTDRVRVALPRGDERELTERLRRARAELDTLTEGIRTEHPEFMSQGLTLPELLALIPPVGALVAPLLTSQGSAAFVVPHGATTVTAEEVVVLEEFKDADLQVLLQGRADEGQLGGWLGAYSEFRDSGAMLRWFDTLESDTRVLWQRLMGPVHERLQALGLAPGAPVLLMPQGGLGLLPLHAAWREAEGRRRYFFEDFTVTYLPSGYALDIARRRLQAPERQRRSLLAVINPTKDLQFTEAEGEAVSALFPNAAKLLKEDQATTEAVQQAAVGQSYLHFSCHGYYAWQDPMRSGLLMANEAPLTLAEIIVKLDLSACRLVTLSACETGISEFSQSPDEFLGLPAGFLQAGAPGVLSTLWAVSDLSTMLLMVRFYKHHLEEKLPPAAALRQAQRWLREVTAGELRRRFSSERELILSRTRLPEGLLNEKYEFFAAKKDSERPFAHPFYWAAFTFSGV